MTGELLREHATLTIEEVCENCQLSEIEIKSYVEEGIIEVEGHETGSWRFSETTIVQVKKASRLKKDLGLNPAGVAVALELMSRIEDLEKRLYEIEG